MAPITQPSHLANTLATSMQLEISASQLDGVPRNLEDSVRFETARLLQAAGMLLRLPQDLVAQSIVLLHRFWTGADGASMLEHDAKDVACAALYLAAKPSASSVSPKHALTVFEYLSALDCEYASISFDKDARLATVSACLTEGKYEAARDRLYQLESHILRVLGFQTHVALPYTLCINYMQTLDVFSSPSAPVVAKQALAYLNTALLSPQLLYLTHQPPALATAATYLAAREMNAKLPETEWWEVFDVDREELGFVVVALQSVESFAMQERHRWGNRKVPLNAEELRSEGERAAMLEAGE